MKILFITSHHKLYGANRSMLSIIKHLENKDNEVSVLIPFKGELSEELSRLGIKYHTFPFYPSFLYYKPFSIHIFSLLFGLITFIILPIILKKIKGNYDIIYSNSSAECLGYYIAKIKKTKHIVHVREFLSLDYNLYYYGGDIKKKQHLLKSDGLVFVSKTLAETVLKTKELRNNEKVIYNGISIKSDFQELKKVSKKKIINIGMIGIICEAKGQELAIDYFSRIPNENLSLHLYGSGNEKYISKINELIKKLDLENKVILHGYASNNISIYNAIDALLMFSRAEAFGRVTIESMLTGVPVIGFDNAGTSELIEHNKTGLLFHDFTTFSESISHLFHDEEYNKIRKNAFVYAKKHFTEEKYCNSVEKFMHQTINKK